MDENQLTRSRTNHNVGVRVTYLKCGHNGCPKRLRLVHNLVNPEAVSRYKVQEVAETVHNHNVIIPRARGLTVQQKRFIEICVDRGQTTPKEVTPFFWLAKRKIVEISD